MAGSRDAFWDGLPAAAHQSLAAIPEGTYARGLLARYERAVEKAANKLQAYNALRQVRRPGNRERKTARQSAADAHARARAYEVMLMAYLEHRE